jgi:hypothetical protein
VPVDAVPGSARLTAGPDTAACAGAGAANAINAAAAVAAIVARIIMRFLLLTKQWDKR